MTPPATLTDRPEIFPEQFARIECNRCGNCCEQFSLPFSPLEFITSGGLNSWTKNAELRRAQKEDSGRRDHETSALSWLAELEPLPDELQRFEAQGHTLYSCPRFARDADGRGVCTIHARRPQVCVGFPNGEGYRASTLREFPVSPENHFHQCSFNVRFARPEPLILDALRPEPLDCSEEGAVAKYIADTDAVQEGGAA